jgi:hypothetical protein
MFVGPTNVENHDAWDAKAAEAIVEDVLCMPVRTFSSMQLHMMHIGVYDKHHAFTKGVFGPLPSRRLS